VTFSESKQNELGRGEFSGTDSSILFLKHIHGFQHSFSRGADFCKLRDKLGFHYRNISDCSVHLLNTIYLNHC